MPARTSPISRLTPFPSRVRTFQALAFRTIHTSPFPHRNLLAKYLARTPLSSSSPGGPFITSSTTPAATSFQEVPPPQSAVHQVGSKTVHPVPAMIQTSSSTSGNHAPVPDGDKEVVVAGVHIPPRPKPPGSEECCMSGCVHCVYTIYADDLEAYQAALSSARSALRASGTPESEWPTIVRESNVVESSSRSTGTLGLDEVVEKAQPNIDPSMAAFLALENKLRKSQAPQSSAAAR